MKNAEARKSHATPQKIYTAEYRNHPVERYNSNPLIRALPVLPDAAKLAAIYSKFPEYSDDERNDDRSVKVLKLQQLFRFYVALPRVVELSETLHAMICEGYIGRAPFSREDNDSRLKHYEL